MIALASCTGGAKSSDGRGWTLSRLTCNSARRRVALASAASELQVIHPGRAAYGLSSTMILHESHGETSCVLDFWMIAE